MLYNGSNPRALKISLLSEIPMSAKCENSKKRKKIVFLFLMSDFFGSPIYCKTYHECINQNTWHSSRYQLQATYEIIQLNTCIIYRGNRSPLTSTLQALAWMVTIFRNPNKLFRAKMKFSPDRRLVTFFISYWFSPSNFCNLYGHRFKSHSSSV